MTVIGVVSDTHMPRFGTALPRALECGLREANVERILHLGDMTDLLAVPLFEAIAPFDAVGGLRSRMSLNTRIGIPWLGAGIAR
jgi:predicted phosphodiesterase